ncbi:MAG: diguanylate cyclase [Pseudomonadota bacterium]|nr:diguanylate cyclase [Pseudomonadota bacterium]
MNDVDPISAGSQAARAQQQFREFADAMPHILWTAEPDGMVDYLNKVYTDRTGVTLDVPSQSWLNALHPDDVARTVAVWSDCVATGKVYAVEFRVIDIVTNAYRWQAVTAKPVRDAQGVITKWYGIATDVHERKVADERANLLASRLDATIESMSDGFVMIDRAGHIIHSNRMAELLLRRPRADLLGEVLWQVFPELVETRLYGECIRAFDDKCAIEYEGMSTLFHHWFEIRIYPAGELVSICFCDISHRESAEAEIQRLAFHDQLTGLPNRQLLRDRLQHALLMTRRAQRIGAVMFIDLDNFKTLNDTQGHHMGDCCCSSWPGA